MAFTTDFDIIDAAKIELKEVVDDLENSEIERAASKALTELGWSLPTTSSGQEYWLVERAVRHSIHMLMVASAKKFKFKQINLQQRFEHYRAMIKDMDEAYLKAIEDDPALFSSAEATDLFGNYIRPGFIYDVYGNDFTYHEDT